ncbi:MAG: 16S rRNA (guanine(966)-N(2))-methyltransferase RsmD [Clostridia bacterium]|nr:16S rRNA (guanine(966)-N(2))-methyltransferase RsmD [Clostridia bacterium]
MVRIIAGSARGRKLETLEGLETRPTLDRVKEALFGSLQFRIPYAEVLDLFSGSGNLGLEALSRGAKRAVLNDRNPACAEIIRKNAATLGFSELARTMNLDYAAAIDRLADEGATFDLAFLDPPYREGLSADAIGRLFEKRLIKPGGIVILEHAAELAPKDAPGIFRVARTKRFGKCGYSFIEEDGE